MTQRPHRWSTATGILLLAAVCAGFTRPAQAGEPQPLQLAQEVGQPVDEPPTEPPPRELQPRYQPVPPQPKSWYNDTYIFAITRCVANSTLAPAAQAPLYLLTVPVDLVLLPFAAIGGLFG